MIIKPENTEALVEAILKLKGSPEFCDELGHAAYKTISELLTEERIVEERIDIYKQTIQDAAGKYASFNLSFLGHYTTFSRLVYFSCRRFIKKIFKG